MTFNCQPSNLTTRVQSPFSPRSVSMCMSHLKADDWKGPDTPAGTPTHIYAAARFMPQPVDVLRISGNTSLHLQKLFCCSKHAGCTSEKDCLQDLHVCQLHEPFHTTGTTWCQAFTSRQWKCRRSTKCYDGGFNAGMLMHSQSVH